MRRRIEVYLGDGGQPIGHLLHDAQGAREAAAYEYSTEWMAATDRFAIGPGLPLARGPQFHRKTGSGSVFHASIADTEPEGWGRRVILRDHAKRRQEARGAGTGAETRPLNGLDFLLAVDDDSRIGALRFKDEQGLFRDTAPEGRRRAPSLIELGPLLAASHAVESSSETTADLAYLRGRGTSLGGLRPKCMVIDEDGRLSIGKFPSITDQRAVTKGEVLALRLATVAGVDAAHARLVESDGLPVAVIRRFDRDAGGRRLMYVSAATMLGVEPHAAEEQAYTQIVDALRVHGAAPAADIEELWRRIAFSIMITNVDDHLLNHGFLHVARGLWRLSPAFDVNPFPDRQRELKTWISEESGPEASIEALMATAPYFRLTAARARELLGAVENAVAGWRDAGRRIGMTALELDQLAEAFEHRERRVARRVLGRVA